MWGRLLLPFLAVLPMAFDAIGDVEGMKRGGATPMATISEAGLLVARVIAKEYASYPAVRAIMVGGSVARACADEYSDLEIGVFWGQLPTVQVRQATIARIGGHLACQRMRCRR